MRILTFLLLPLLLGVFPLASARAEGTPTLTTPDGIRKALGSGEAGTRLLAVRAARDVQDRKLLAPLVKCLRDEEREVRRAAIEVLGLREGKERKSAARGLAGRLDSYLEPSADAEEHGLVIQALHDLAEPASIKPLLDVPVACERGVVRARAMAVANVPDAAAIEALIQFGSRGRRGAGNRDITRDALTYATGRRFRTNPDDWRTWWRAARKHFDFDAAFAARTEARETREAKQRQKAERRRQRREREERGSNPPPRDETGSGIDDPI